MKEIYCTVSRDRNVYINLERDFGKILNNNFIPKEDVKKKYFTFKQEVYNHNHNYSSQFYTPWGAIKLEETIDINAIKNPEEAYHTFKIPKKTGGFRDICAPDDKLKEIQTDILKLLKRACPYPHEAAHAYIEDRSIRTALEAHVNNDSHWYLKLDLHSFFPSCTTELVMRKLELVYPLYKLSNQSREIIKKYCFKDGALPQGAPTSPYLSNIIMVQFDYAMTKYCKDHDLIYTRYADDIIISGYKQFGWKEVQYFVEQVLAMYYPGIEINKDKTRYGNVSGRNWNLGLMVNKDGITVGNQRKRRLKQMLYNFSKTKDSGEWKLNDLQTLLGELQYVCMIEPDIYDKMFKPKFGDVRKDIIDLIKIA